jgi:hypothetical protein
MYFNVSGSNILNCFRFTLPEAASADFEADRGSTGKRVDTWIRIKTIGRKRIKHF